MSSKMGKVLLVTGALAEDTVKRYAEESPVPTETFALKIQVAAFLTPETILKSLQNVDLKGFDAILVPGLVRGDTALISKATGIKTFKGPRYAADLPTILELLGKTQLSTVIPACELLREELAKKAMAEIEKTEQNRKFFSKSRGAMLIGSLAVGKEFPMRVLAEIVDAALMDTETIQPLRQKIRGGGGKHY